MEAISGDYDMGEAQCRGPNQEGTYLTDTLTNVVEANMLSATTDSGTHSHGLAFGNDKMADRQNTMEEKSEEQDSRIVWKGHIQMMLVT